MLNIIIVIPARWASSRLPGKPLIKIKNIPMIIRTYNQCLKVFPKNKIIIATDNKKIKEFCDTSQIKSIMTSKNCLTGTDRVAEVAQKIKADIYINVQGDEPIFNTNDLKKIVNFAKKYPNEIINGYTRIRDEKLFISPNIPKVIFRKDGRLLYQSRAPIPNSKKFKFTKAYRQVCIYAFPRKALKVFKSCKKKTPIEYIEDLELLRFLEIGHEIRMIKMSNQSISVDVRSDIKKVEDYLNKKKL